MVAFHRDRKSPAEAGLIVPIDRKSNSTKIPPFPRAGYSPHGLGLKKSPRRSRGPAPELPDIGYFIQHSPYAVGNNIGIGDDQEHNHPCKKNDDSSEQSFHDKILPILPTGRFPKLRIGGLHEKKAPAALPPEARQGALGPATVAQPAGPIQAYTPVSGSQKESPGFGQG